MLEPFSYVRLADPTREIRLLRAQRGSGESQAPKEGCSFLPQQPLENTPARPSSRSSLSWTLTHESIDNCPKYTALSYAWGDPAAVVSIIVNGKVFHLANNVSEALRAISGHPEEPYLWIDAVCINQSDNAERSSQVPLMHRIYGEAEHVLIWLGLPTHGSCNALEILAELGWKYPSLRTDDTEPVIFDADTPYYMLAQRYVKNVDDLLWRDILAIFHRPWWRRVWVIQEAILAKEASIMCGSLIISWYNILKAIHFFSLLSVSDDPGIASRAGEVACTVGHFNLVDQFYIKSCEEGTPGLTVENLITSIRYTDPGIIKATDTRDHIYGLMGLLRAEDREAITVDYSDRTTIANIYHDVCCILVGRNGPKVMSSCQPVTMHRNGLPSWAFDVLDIDATRGPALIGRSIIHEENAPYHASAGTSWTPCKLRIPFERPKLTVRAIEHGKVEQLIHSVVPPLVTMEAFGTWILELETKTRDIASGKISEADIDYFLSTIWLVPIAGISRQSWRRPTREQDNELLQGFKILVGVAPKPESVIDDNEAFAKWFRSGTYLYFHSLKIFSNKAFVTSAGLPGLGPEDLIEDDIIVICEGAHNPFALREQSDGTFRMIGPCYILGLMFGESVKADVVFQDIVLV